jgi:hypothetical protein
MKRILRLFACLILLTGTVGLAETLTNDSVIQLHKLGLGDSVVVQKIKASTCQFDTSVDGLKALKDAGLSDEIIQAMLLVSTSPAPAPVPAPTAAAPGDPNDPKAAHASGIYLYQEVDGKPKMTQMSPSRVEDVSSGSGWGVAFGGSAKTRAVLSGAHAQTQLKETEPVFYFYFAKSDASLGSMDVSATSPDDFALGIMEAHVSHDQPVRRLEISKVNMGGYHAGLNKKDVRPFTTEKISEGVFKVTPTSLKPGEYAFIQLVGARMVTALKMFDFGIAGGGK